MIPTGLELNPHGFYVGACIYIPHCTCGANDYYLNEKTPTYGGFRVTPVGLEPSTWSR